MRYILKKFFSMLLTLFMITTATFFLMKAIPGDPFTQEKAVPPEILRAMREHYHLNDPLLVQYGHYLLSVIQWDLGPSFKYKALTVNSIINSGFPVSAILGLEAMIIAIFGGLSLGIIAAVRQNKWADYGSMIVAVGGISVPSFIVATTLQYFLSLKWGLFPVARWGTFQQSVLPAISLSLFPMAFIARLTRSSMIEVLSQDYIKTARAKGLTEWMVIWKHAVQNSLLPVVSYLGLITANILTGTFVVEKIFGIPGLGQLVVSSIANRDYTVIMGTTVFYSIFLLVTIFIVDVAYSLIDPRIKVRDTKAQ